MIALARPAGGGAQQALGAGSAAPDFSLPIVANGTGSFDLRQQRGHGVYVNFFASWCGPCKQEVGELEKAARAHEPEITTLGIAVLDSREDALAFVRDHALTYPIVLDETGKVGAAYRLNQLPLHVFIGPDGRIKQSVAGGPISAAELQAGFRAIAR
jgi:cytochrome c biogenesis protein CcmG, thiol:disulfide interchange protein DsbE